MKDQKPSRKTQSANPRCLQRLVRRLEQRLADWKQLEYVRRRERNFWREKYLKTEKALHYVHVAQAKIYNITSAVLWPAQEQRQADSPNSVLGERGQRPKLSARPDGGR